MRQGSTASFVTALSGLLFILASQDTLPFPILAVGLPMRVIAGGSAALGTAVFTIARILLAASWLALLLFESRRYLLSWMFSHGFPRSHSDADTGCEKET